MGRNVTLSSVTKPLRRSLSPGSGVMMGNAISDVTGSFQSPEPVGILPEAATPVPTWQVQPGSFRAQVPTGGGTQDLFPLLNPEPTVSLPGPSPAPRSTAGAASCV